MLWRLFKWLWNPQQMLAEHRAEQVRIDAELVAAFAQMLNPEALRETAEAEAEAGSLPRPPLERECVEVDPSISMRWLFIQCPAGEPLMIDEEDATLFQEPGAEPYLSGRYMQITLKRNLTHITRNVLVQKAKVHVR